MKYSIREVGRSIWNLFRFVFWYGLVVSGVLVLLPRAAVYVQGQYDALSSIARLAALLGLVLVVAIWQVRDIRARSFRSLPEGMESSQQQ